MSVVDVPPSLPVAEAPAEAPSAAFVAGGVAGLLALGGSAALAAGDLRLLGGPLLAAIGSAALTTPTLVVAHELCGVDAPPARSVQVVVTTVARTGQLALWLSPIVLFFAAASYAWAGVYLVALLGLGGVALFAGASRLRRLDPAKALPVAVSFGWAVLAGAVALHLLGGTFAAFD